MEVQRLAGPAIGMVLDLPRQHDSEELVNAITRELGVYGIGMANRTLPVPGVDGGLEGLAAEPEEPGPR